MYFKNHLAYLLPERWSSAYTASWYTNGQKVAPLKIRLIDDRDHMLFPFYNKTKANCFLINHGFKIYTNGASVIRMIKQNCFWAADRQSEFEILYYYMRNFCKLIALERWYFSLIWNTYMSKLQNLCG